MGYYTEHTLEIIEGDIELCDLLEQLDEEKYSELFYSIDEAGYSLNPSKWYDSVKDMKEISLKFPTVTFMLCGSGEDLEDRWKFYFKNGKHQECFATVVFPEYDPTKLV